MFCKSCGKEISAGIKFCPSCGNPIDSIGLETVTIPNKKKNTNTILKIIGIAVAIILSLIIISTLISDPIDRGLDKFESAIVRMEKLSDKYDEGKISEGELIVEYQKIMDDLEEMEDFFDSYDDSDLTAEQWDRLLSLMERANRLDTYSYY